LILDTLLRSKHLNVETCHPLYSLIKVLIALPLICSIRVRPDGANAQIKPAGH